MKSNPLATRFVAPGRVSWQAVYGAPDVHQLAELFTHRLQARAAIIGPHGSGKSTLVEHLIPLLGVVVVDRAADRSLSAALPDSKPFQSGIISPAREIIRLRLRGWWSSTRLLMQTASQWLVPRRILIIDGYEQLPRVIRVVLILATRTRGAGLLITSHRRTALPTLVELQVQPELVMHLLDQLLPQDVAGRANLLDVPALRSMLDKHRGNVRELFMELYDVLEERV